MFWISNNLVEDTSEISQQQNLNFEPFHNLSHPSRFLSVLIVDGSNIFFGPSKSWNLSHDQVEDDTEILIRYNVRGRGPKFWTGT